MIIKKLINEVKIKLWDNIQVAIEAEIPNRIIDQGWHQKGFRSQNFSSELLFIIIVDLNKS